MQLTGSVSGLRVGLMKEGFTGAKDDVAQTVKAAANSLKQLGVTVEEFSYPPHRDCKSSFLHSINTKNQWRRQGVCRPGQTSVLPPSNHIGNRYSYGYNDGTGADCHEQYAKLGECNYVMIIPA